VLSWRKIQKIMKKIGYISITFVTGLAVWVLSGGISSSREKIVPQALWKAVSSKDAQDNADSDKDGLTDTEEKKLGTDPNKADTDGDGFMDGQEVKKGCNPLKPPPGDCAANNNSNVNNNNGNFNGNNNRNNNQAGIVINNNSSGTAAEGNSSATTSSPKENVADKENVTEKVALKVDEIIAKYKLYSTPYNTLSEDTRTEIEKNLNEFAENILKNTNLDFAFNIPRENLSLIETEEKDKDQYISRAKDILRQHNLLSENQTIEEGLRAILLSLSNMSKKDIEWEKTNNWKREIGLARQELLAMPVNPALETPHVRLLRVVNSLQIVLDNLNEGDYFRSFLAAGRAEKINVELDKFSEEVK